MSPTESNSKQPMILGTPNWEYLCFRTVAKHVSSQPPVCWVPGSHIPGKPFQCVEILGIFFSGQRYVEIVNQLDSTKETSGVGSSKKKNLQEGCETLAPVASWPITWVVPPPSNSHHQDYCIFSRGSL